MEREENFVLIIHSVSHPQSLLFSANVTSLSLGTTETVSFLIILKLRVNTKTPTLVTGVHCK